MTAHEPHPDHRLRLAVHAAHRAPGARGARVLRDPPAHAHRWSGSASGSPRASSSAAARTPCTATTRPTADRAMFDVAPVLGVCYGMQLIAHLQGGEVTRGGQRQYGRDEIRPTRESALFRGFAPSETTSVWMSHGDHVEAAAAGLPRHRGERRQPGRRRSSTSRSRSIGVQFHPEVAHTPRGGEIIANFLFDVCGATPSWTPGAFIEEEVAKIRAPGGRRAGHLRPVGRRGLVGGRGARAPRDRRPAHLRVRRHGPAAPARARAGGADDAAGTSASSSSRSTRRRASSPRSRASRSRRRSGAPSATPSSTSSRRRRRSAGHAREVPRAGDALSRRDRELVAHRRPVGDDQDAPQRRRAQARTCSSR